MKTVEFEKNVRRLRGRSRRGRLWLALMLLLLCAPLDAAPQPESGSPLDLSELDALAWMAGCWGSSEGASSADECWLERRGNVMMGFHVDVFGDERVFFEYLRIVADEDGLSYLASPMGGEPTTFRLVACEESRAVFENPQHDWPQRITYWREGDRLHARAEGLDDQSRKATWSWERRPGS